MPKKAVNESPEMRELRAQLEEAQETLNAIRRGEVDGLVVSTPKGEQVYSISGAEKPYRVLMENMREGAITLSDDNTILYCNLGFAKMMKVPLEKIVGSNIENKISPTFKIAFRELLAKCRARPKQEAETKGITFIADDKTLVPTQISVNSLSMDHTTTTFIVVTDLTQHMEEDLKRYTTDLEKAGAALFESEQRWSTTLGSIGDAVIATDIAGKITYMNEVAEELTGWPLEKASGKPVQAVFKIISAATRKIVDDPVAKVLKKGQIVGLANHTTLIRQNGTEVPIDDSGAPIKDKEGKTTGVVLIFRDITERKRAEEALRYNELLLTGFFDSIGHMRGIVEVINGKDVRHVKDNEVTASYVGLTPADLKGKLSSELGEPAERIKTWIEHYKQSQKTGKPVTWEYTDREGSKVTWLSPTVTYIGKSSEGNPRFTYVVTDITERKKAEEELKRSEENARQRAEELRKFMDIIPAAVWLSRDPECKVIVGNQAANTFYEAEGEENVSAGPASGKAQDTTRRFFRNGKELMPQELPMQEAAAKNVEIKNSELEVIVPSGRKIAILGNAKPLLDDVGKVRGCLGAFVDITERKKAEETLTKKQDELQTIIDSSQGLIFYKDRENHFIRVNKAFAKIMGLPKEQLEGRSLFEIYPKEEAEAFWSDDKQVIASGKAKVGIEEKMQSKQGQRWVQTDKIPYRDAEGNIIGVIGFTVDITERKKAEEALKESETRYRMLFERMEEGFTLNEIICDENRKPYDLRYLAVNPAFERQTGLKAADVIGKTTLELFPDTEPAEFERYGKVALTGEPIRFEEYFAGLNRWFEVLAFQTEPGKFATIFTDITKRKQAEEALSRINEELEERVQKRTQEVSSERQRLYNVLETLPAYVVLLDKDYRMPFANKVFRDTFGESHGRRCHEYLFGRDSECENCETYKVLKTDKPQHWEWTGPNGHDYEIYDYPFVEADGSTLILEMGLDVTERKKAERQAQEAAKKLQDSERLAAIGATAGMVGHDIRNPLQAITGDLFLAKSELSELPENENKTNAIESLDEIQNNIEYINKIVADLQDYARPLNPRAQETNIESVFNEILTKNGTPKNIKVSVDIEDKAKKIMADPDYLKRIAANLTLNAVQAMPKGGKLTIHSYVDRATNDVLITVKDTGVGIPEHIKPKLFTPMMTTKAKGQGFGLAVVKRMTEGLGGTVTFESTQGKGTTFIVRLPPSKS